MMHLVYLKLELKRALKKLPTLYAGAIVLLFFMGTIALVSVKSLYGEARTGRIAVGVVLPEDDLVAAQALKMLESLDSVKSICDFSYMTGEQSRTELLHGGVAAVLEVPDGFVSDIMQGINTPVKLIFPRNAGTEALVFGELTNAGARTLGASQAGIYAGDELLGMYQLNESIPQLEADLNRIYLSYSLPREDYFRHYQVSATGDVKPQMFYAISACVLLLLFLPIPVCGYLSPLKPVLRRKLEMAGIGAWIRILARTCGLALLLLAVLGPVLFIGVWQGLITWWSGGLPVLALICLAAAAFIVCLYQLTANPLGGIMLLFLAGIGQHFIAGGFLPSVFLPSSFRLIAPVMPSAILMKGIQMITAGIYHPPAIIGLLLLLFAGYFISLAWEVKLSCE